MAAEPERLVAEPQRSVAEPSDPREEREANIEEVGVASATLRAPAGGVRGASRDVMGAGSRSACGKSRERGVTARKARLSLSEQFSRKSNLCRL